MEIYKKEFDKSTFEGAFQSSRIKVGVLVSKTIFGKKDHIVINEIKTGENKVEFHAIKIDNNKNEF